MEVHSSKQAGALLLGGLNRMPDPAFGVQGPPTHLQTQEKPTETIHKIQSSNLHVLQFQL